MLAIYVKVLDIVPKTMERLVLKYVIPAACSYTRALAETAAAKAAVSGGLPCKAEKAMLAILSELLDQLYERNVRLEAVLRKTRTIADLRERALSYAHDVLPAMQELRAAVDKTEVNCAKTYWPYPTYGEMLSSV